MWCRAIITEAKVPWFLSDAIIIVINKIYHASKEREQTWTKGDDGKGRESSSLSTLLSSITTKIEVLRDGNKPYGTVARLVAHHQIFLPWLTRDHVNNHLRKLNKLGRSTNHAVSPCALSALIFLRRYQRWHHQIKIHFPSQLWYNCTQTPVEWSKRHWLVNSV